MGQTVCFWPIAAGDDGLLSAKSGQSRQVEFAPEVTLGRINTVVCPRLFRLFFKGFEEAMDSGALVY